MRTLPWKNKSASGGRSTKRSRVEVSSSDSDENSNYPHKQIRGVSHGMYSGEQCFEYLVNTDAGREPSTSPPPEPPAESFMEEGQEHDDRYRIVEDELLAVAKSFTVHLHTAEYKRLGKIAKTRNADTINSILRPVVGKLPDATKRKTDEVARSKGQRDIMVKLSGKKEDGLSDNSDEETLPFVGTSLYGLMTSPKKRGISLMNISYPMKTTRAAAGFRNPTKMKAVQRPASPSIKRKTGVINLDTNSTASEDDDLDGPISAPKFSSSRANINKDIAYTKSTARVTTGPKAAKPIALPSSKTPAPLETNLFKSAKASVADSSSHSSATQDRIARRIAHAKVKKKQEEEEKKKLDIIPTFL
ncbi:hypothetical protein DSL72_003079 [Monilinia vaccinii-corymbosi]|uniref:Uncharacterized protein n=1 Tax=Monilinia vaccinii-corymbosi TaxID=61207 RepID=A0A8A3P1A4_9HELO|nr:hypothetical protein DSL72_003079 [Monilinia vaccinii-corymbosi]